MVTVKTIDDRDVLDDFLYNYSNEGRFWIGLKKKSTYTTCSNSACNNELVWSDGSEFIFNHELDIDANIDGKCFVYDQYEQAAIDGQCTNAQNEFLCQYECPASSDPCKTISVDLCMFSFYYLGETYNECTGLWPMGAHFGVSPTFMIVLALHLTMLLVLRLHNGGRSGSWKVMCFPIHFCWYHLHRVHIGWQSTQ